MLPTLAKLNKAQNAAYSFMSGAVARNIGANAALEQYKAIGGMIRRQTGLDLYRYVAGTQKAGFTISNIRKDYFPSARTLPDSLTNIRREYSFNVRLDLKNNFTGEGFERNITITTDSLMRISDIEDEGVIAFLESQEQSGWSDIDIQDVTIVEARKRAPLFAREE